MPLGAGSRLGPYEILSPIGTGATRAAGGKWQISTAYSSWSRDGRALYYLAPDQRIMVVEHTPR